MPANWRQRSASTRASLRERVNLRHYFATRTELRARILDLEATVKKRDERIQYLDDRDDDRDESRAESERRRCRAEDALRELEARHEVTLRAVTGILSGELLDKLRQGMRGKLPPHPPPGGLDNLAPFLVSMRDILGRLFDGDPGIIDRQDLQFAIKGFDDWVAGR